MQSLIKNTLRQTHRASLYGRAFPN
jgi:hypothetical protein